MKKTFWLILILCAFFTFAQDSAITPSGIPIPEIGNRIDELVANYMHESAPGLAVVVVKDGEIVFSRGYGYADIEKQIPIVPDITIFEYGSVSKLFVYISVMQLLERGLLDLDADIHRYLPQDLSRQFNFEKNFTLRDLLNHSAGFGEFFFNAFLDADKTKNETSLREGLLNSQPKQIFEPRTASSYSNFGSALLAYVVSFISGQEFAVFERENIIAPTGMTGTKNQPDWFNNNEFLQHKAKGYMPDGKGGFISAPWWYITIYPAGAMNGTAEDLARLAIALTPPQEEAGILFTNRNTLDLMLSPSFPDPKIMRGMHHGFFRYDGIYPTFGHSGGTGGFGTELAVVPSERFGVAILSNSVIGMKINSKILDLLAGNSIDSLSPSASNLPDAKSVAGNYVLLRRHTANILEPLNFVLGTNVRVDAIDENTITLNMMGGIIAHTYRQAEPYLFRLISANGPLAHAASEIYFKMENGKPVKLSMSAPFDATPQTFSQSMAVFAGNAVILAISVIFFLVMPIIILIGFLRKKQKDFSRFNCLSSALLFVGTLFTLNIITLILRVSAAVPFIQTSMITPHIWINYILLISAGILFAVSALFLRIEKIAKKRKILHFSTAFLLSLFVFVLWQWNYFVMM